MNKKVLLIVGGLLGLTAVCCVGIIIFGYIYDQSDQNDGETRSLVGLKVACAGESVLETAEFDRTVSGIHPTALLQAVNDEYIFPTTTWNYSPDFLEESELVVCLDDVVETVTETCEYTLEDNAGDATITRISLVADYRLIATQTGKVVDEGTVKANPRLCEDEETFQDNASFTLRGNLGEALEPLLIEYISVP